MGGLLLLLHFFLAVHGSWYLASKSLVLLNVRVINLLNLVSCLILLLDRLASFLKTGEH